MTDFIGRLHPLIVHLPIGFVLLSVILDFYGKRIAQGSKQLALFSWSLTALSSIAAVVTGLVLVNSGHYEGFEVFLHRWTAIAIAVTTSLIAISLWTNRQWFSAQNSWLKVVTILLLFVAGHKGGEITHGPGFLPLPFVSQGLSERILLEDKDSIQLYEDIIARVFQAKCVRCHEDGDERGRLNLTSIESMTSDKFGDPAIQAGNPLKSEAFKRVILAQEDPKFMPPSGRVLTYAELRILEYWIDSGASFDEYINAESEVPVDIKKILIETFKADFSKKSVYEKLNVSAASEELVRSVSEAQFNVGNIASGINLLEVNRLGHPGELDKDEVAKLLQIKDQITWLDLSNTSVGDDIGTIIQQFPNLTKLKVQNTQIGDGLIKAISNLKNIEVLNVYNTEISDDGLGEIGKLKNLKTLYIWQTRVTQNGIQKLRDQLPELEIIQGAI